MSAWANRVYLGSCESMAEIPDESVHACVTSPPYFGLRDYGVGGQIGLESTVEEYVARLVGVFREVRRVLRKDGTAWLNLGDSYAAGTMSGKLGSTSIFLREGGANAGRGQRSTAKIARRPRSDLKPKDLIGVPWRVAFALQADGWYLRDAIVWAKPNPMQSSVRDRCTSSYEFVFMLAKSKRYYAEMDAVREPLAESSVSRFAQDLDAQEGSSRANGGAKTNGTMKAVYKHNEARVTSQESPNRVWSDPEAKSRILANGANLRNVWSISTEAYSEAHFAVFPRELARRCILIGCPSGGVVLDPFMGSGTVADVAIGCGRQYVGYELNPGYHRLIEDRLGLFRPEAAS